MDVKRLVVSENGESSILLEDSFKEIKKYILNKFDDLTGWMYDPSVMFHLNEKEIKKELKEFKEFQKDIKNDVKSSKNFDDLETVLYKLSSYLSWWRLRIEEIEEEEGGKM